MKSYVEAADEQDGFPVVVFTMLLKKVLTSEFLDEILKFSQLNESFRA